LLAGITLLGLGDLELPSQSLPFGNCHLVAFRQLRQLLLERGSLFGLFFRSASSAASFSFDITASVEVLCNCWPRAWMLV